MAGNSVLAESICACSITYPQQIVETSFFDHLAPMLVATGSKGDQVLKRPLSKFSRLLILIRRLCIVFRIARSCD